jgi:hypothetical protein
MPGTLMSFGPIRPDLSSGREGRDPTVGLNGLLLPVDGRLHPKPEMAVYSVRGGGGNRV